MKKAVFGLAANENQANLIVIRLLSSGFSNEDISLLFPNGGGKSDIKGVRIETRTRNYEGVEEISTEEQRKGSLTTEKHTKAPEGGVAGATTGGLLGGSLGLLAGIGALAIPGFGPFIAAGPLMAALSGSAIGGSLGLLIGTLVGAGIPEYEAKKYEAGLRDGNILICAHADTDEEIRRATEVMKKEGAKDISSTSEKLKSTR